MAVVSLSTAVENAMLNSVAAAIDGGAGPGLIKVYSGLMPATPETAITTQVLLATLTFSDPAFTPAASSVLSANLITPGVAVASGIAAWARITTSAGTAVMDVDVATSNGTIVLNTTNIEADALVQILETRLRF